MKNRIYKYFFHEFLRYFSVVIFGLTAVIWTIQAVNFLDLVTDDGHAFRIYLLYSILNVPKMLTKLIPFSFLIASILTILKLEKDNELIVLWTSGLNKIYIVNLVFRISILIMIMQLIKSVIINPQTLNTSRTLLKNSELQFVGSLLKEKQFNDTLKGLTVFVDKKNNDGTFENIFIRDEGNVLSQVSSGSSTIFAKSGYLRKNDKTLVLSNGNIQKLEKDGGISVIKFETTALNLSGLSTKTTPVPKIQETPTLEIIQCVIKENIYLRNCKQTEESYKENVIEFNKRFGMPMFIPLISLIVCFLLSSRKEKKASGAYKYLYFFIGLFILIIAEITVRYSGISWGHTAYYYLTPIGLLPLVYLFLIRVFKYENLN